jgi:hypothetical protein
VVAIVLLMYQSLTMKKYFSFLLLFSFISLLAHGSSSTSRVSSSYTLSKQIFNNSDVLVNLIEILVKRQRVKTITLLAKSENKNDRNIADLLKNKKFIDCVNVIFDNKTTYLQFNNTRTPRILLSKPPQPDMYHNEKIAKGAKEIFEKLPEIFKLTIAVYLSNNYRKEQTTFLQQLVGPALKDDLYSASIFISRVTEDH